MESKLTQTLIYVKDRDKVKSIKIHQKKWWMKRRYFFNPFPFSLIPPSLELFNFNTSCVSAGPEIAQASKNSQWGHKVTKIQWIIYGFCNNKRRVMYFEGLDGDTETRLFKLSKLRFSGSQKTKHKFITVETPNTGTNKLQNVNI